MLIGGLLALMLILVAANLLGSAEPGGAGIADEQTSQQMTEGRQIYMAQCASCHGASLEGQPGW